MWIHAIIHYLVIYILDFNNDIIVENEISNVQNLY